MKKRILFWSSLGAGAGLLFWLTRSATARQVWQAAQNRYLAVKYRYQRKRDDELTERVKARIATAISKPQAIQVNVIDGCVELSGELPVIEMTKLVDAVLAVPGVRSV